jgi:hypothetical protein
MASPHRTRFYARVYADDLASEFPDVWNDPHLFWTWCRLLVVAEKMWPTIPEFPRFLSAKRVKDLTDLGIIEKVGPHGFRIRGLDAERARRAAAARHAANTRHGNADGNAGSSPDRNADGNAEPVPSPSRTSPSLPSIPPNPPPRGGRRSKGTNPRALRSKDAEAEEELRRRRERERTQSLIHERGAHADTPRLDCPDCRERKAS